MTKVPQVPGLEQLEVCNGVGEERVVEVGLLVAVLGVYLANKQGHADERAEIMLVGPQFFR
jgi:hypothetical protein